MADSELMEQELFLQVAWTGRHDKEELWGYRKLSKLGYMVATNILVSNKPVLREIKDVLLCEAERIHQWYKSAVIEGSVKPEHKDPICVLGEVVPRTDYERLATLRYWIMQEKDWINHILEKEVKYIGQGQVGESVPMEHNG